MSCLKWIVKLLVIIGALNWGLVGFFQYDLVASLFGGMSTMGARVVYSLVGLAGLCSLWWFIKCCGSSGCGSCGCKSGSCGCCKKGRED